jgi:hypothetical protein
MKVAIHQPDLLPYSGFWFKLATSDRFVIASHDQFQKHGYQRRVMMRDAWCSHQLVGKPSLVPIDTIQVAPGWQQRIVDVVRGRYAGARHFQDRGRVLMDRILECEGERLDEVNLAMIRVVQEMLEIRTELVLTDPPVGSGIERLIEQVQMVGGTSYLSGAGGAAYLGEDAADRFAAEGIELAWSRHRHVTGDSIVTLLLDHDDPLSAVLDTHG